MVQDGESAQTSNEQVCVQLPTSADNVTLLAFPAEAPAVQQSIDISWPPGPQQQTRRGSVRPPNDGTDRQTDARQFRRHCSAYYASSVNRRSCASYRERKCADTLGTVLVHWAGHFKC